MADEVVLYPSGGVQRSVVAVAFPRGARHDVADLRGGAADAVGAVDGGLKDAVDRVGIPAVQIGQRQRHRSPPTARLLV
jgi:hypothetical protein